MTLKTVFRMSIMAALVAPLVASARQTPSQAPAQQSQSAPAKTAPVKPAAKKTVVWTDDNIGSVRSSADSYQIAREQQAEAQKAAAKQGASNQTAAADSTGPKTIEQADTMIAAKSHDLAGEQDYLKTLQKKVNDPTITGLEKKRLEWRLQSHTATTQTLQSEIKQLQSDKDALAKKQAAASQPQSQ